MLSALIDSCPEWNVVGLLLDAAGRCGGAEVALESLAWRLWARAQETGDVVGTAEVYMSLVTLLRRLVLGRRASLAMTKARVDQLVAFRDACRGKIEARRHDISSGEQLSEGSRAELNHELSRLSMIDHQLTMLVNALVEK